MKELIPGDPNINEELIKEALKYAEQITTPPLKEVGGIFADQVRFWRYKNQINILLKAKKFHETKGLKTKKIPVKTLASLVENASLEEDETMQDIWAKLLANATDLNNSFNNHFLIVNILKELSSDEVLILNEFWKESRNFNKVVGKMFNSLNSSYLLGRILEGKGLIGELRIDDNVLIERSQLSIDNLMRLNLVQNEKLKLSRRHYVASKYDEEYEIKKTDRILLTTLGKRLVIECNLD